MVVLLFPVLVQAWLVTMAIEWRKRIQFEGGLGNVRSVKCLGSWMLRDSMEGERRGKSRL